MQTGLHLAGADSEVKQTRTRRAVLHEEPGDEADLVVTVRVGLDAAGEIPFAGEFFVFPSVPGQFRLTGRR